MKKTIEPRSVASIQHQLKQLAIGEKKAYQLILTRYFQERLLFRLATSAYEAQFCLKGGALLYAIEQQTSRPTLDIDLLALGLTRETDRLPAIFREIGRISCETDGVRFDTAHLTAEPITKVGPYPGVRLKLPASLGNIRQVMQIDIGFGDVVTPAPVLMSYPTLLAMEPPQLLAYSLETVIAEKFDAMIDLAEINSRMKDFYDVYRLLAGGQYTDPTLIEAIRQTFRWRQTMVRADHPLFGAGFSRDPRRSSQWQAFLRKTGLADSLTFTDVMDLITVKLLPVYQLLVREADTKPTV